MKHRKLRIAWSVVWGVLAVPLIVLWWRSYWWAEQVTVPLPGGQGIGFLTIPGSLSVVINSSWETPPWIVIYSVIREDYSYPRFWGFFWRSTKMGTYPYLVFVDHCGDDCFAPLVFLAFLLCRGLSSTDGFLHVSPPVVESNCEIRAEPSTRSEARNSTNHSCCSDPEVASKAHSAIRAQEDWPPAHEISCASDDAHSPSRAPDVKSLAPNRATSYRPSSFTPRSRSSVVTRPSVFGKVLL